MRTKSGNPSIGIDCGYSNRIHAQVAIDADSGWVGGPSRRSSVDGSGGLVRGGIVFGIQLEDEQVVSEVLSTRRRRVCYPHTFLRSCVLFCRAFLREHLSGMRLPMRVRGVFLAALCRQ